MTDLHLRTRIGTQIFQHSNQCSCLFFYQVLCSVILFDFLINRMTIIEYVSDKTVNR